MANNLPKPGDYLLTGSKQVYRITEVINFAQNAREGKSSYPTFNLKSLHTERYADLTDSKGPIVWESPIEVKGMTLLELRSFGEIIPEEKANNIIKILY